MKIDTKILPQVARNELTDDYFKALDHSSFNCRENICDIENIIFIYNANDETLKQWETFMGLPERKDYTLRDRQDRVVYTLTNKSIFTKQFLKQQAKIFTNGEIDIQENFPNYHFKIIFISNVGQPPNLENFKNMVNVSKPAHLTYELVFRYNTHGELAQHKLTHEQLKRYTHQQIYDTRVFEDRRS